MRRQLIVPFILAASFVCQSSIAAEPNDKIRKVAVLPVMNYIRPIESLWQPETPKEADNKPHELVIEEYLVRRLAVEPKLTVIDPKGIIKRVKAIPSNTEKIELGLNRMRLGLDFFKSLRLEEAVPHLTQAHAALNEAYFAIVDPQKMSDLLMTLGQCFVEKKQQHQAHVRLKELFFRSPRRQFKRGFYSKELEQAFTSALVDFVATYPKENPLHRPAALERFVADIDVDSLIISYLESSASGPTRAPETLACSACVARLTEQEYRGESIILRLG